MTDERDEARVPGDRLWPSLIVAGLLLVMAVNFTYIWIAVNGADEVVPSYMEEER